MNIVTLLPHDATLRSQKVCSHSLFASRVFFRVLFWQGGNQFLFRASAFFYGLTEELDLASSKYLLRTLPLIPPSFNISIRSIYEWVVFELFMNNLDANPKSLWVKLSQATFILTALPEFRDVSSISYRLEFLNSQFLQSNQVSDFPRFGV
jgi:hypothetical protein